MDIAIDRSTVSKVVLMMSTLYDSDAREVSDNGTFIRIEYSDTDVPDLIEQHAEDYPSFSNEVLAKLVKNMEREVSKRIQIMIDKKAQEYGFTDMNYARSYVSFDNIFRKRATKLAEWGVNCWAEASKVEQMVGSGAIPFPSVDIVMNYMPVYVDIDEED